MRVCVDRHRTSHQIKRRYGATVVATVVVGGAVVGGTVVAGTVVVGGTVVGGTVEVVVVVVGVVAMMWRSNSSRASRRCSLARA